MVKILGGALTQGTINTFAGFTRTLPGRRNIKIRKMILNIVINTAGAVAAADTWFTALMTGTQTSVLTPTSNQCKWYYHTAAAGTSVELYNLHIEVDDLPAFVADGSFTIGFNTASRATNGTDTMYYIIYYDEYKSGY